MVKYFWQVKGSLNRWCDWEEKREDFLREFPRLVAAADALENARESLDEIIESLEIPEGE
jgi:hypothetical protein